MNSASRRLLLFPVCRQNPARACEKDFATKNEQLSTQKHSFVTIRFVYYELAKREEVSGN
jgi:hypothetical protein